MNKFFSELHTSTFHDFFVHFQFLSLFNQQTCKASDVEGKQKPNFLSNTGVKSWAED